MTEDEIQAYVVGLAAERRAEKLKASRQRYLRNIDQRRKYARDWYRWHSERNLECKIRKKFGITFEQKRAILTAQGGTCAICKGDNSNSKRDWHIDHCHKSGVVRGILCHGCNTALGSFKDSPEILAAAIEYLCRQSPAESVGYPQG